MIRITSGEKSPYGSRRRWVFAWSRFKADGGSTRLDSSSRHEHDSIRRLPIDRSELDKLARWIPAKEMALLYEIFDRARSDPDLTRPALLLCSAYAEKVARMLDQDPLPTVTRRIKNRLEELREQHGL